MGGVGSPQMRIRTASKEILSLLNKNTNRDIANIELRPKGIIVRFHSRLENYALVIPYFKLTLFKGEKTVALCSVISTKLHLKYTIRKSPTL